MKRKLPGNNELSIADSLKSIGAYFLEMKSYQESLKYYNESLEIKIKSHGSRDHPSVLNGLFCIGNVYLELGNLNEAMSYFQKILNTT